MKYIFLDFDGVINNWYHFDGVALENVLILKMIVEYTQARIIVTASSKYSLQRDNCDYYKSDFYNTYIKKLNELGITIFDLTPMKDNRSLEIKESLIKYNIKDYVILDDELVTRDLQEHQVFLDLYRGLQIEHIKPAIEILNGNLGFYPPNYNKEESSSELCLRINKYYNEKKK